MKRASAWVNSDGLVVGFGTRSEAKNQASQYNTYGNVQELVYKISDMTALATAATGGTGIYAPQYLVNAPKIPANAVVQEVRVTTNVAVTSGGAADLLVGTYTVHPTTKIAVVVDSTGILAAGDSALADFSVAGETMVLAKGGAGAQIGKTTVGANPVIILPIYVTAVYTAGAVSIHVLYTTAAN